jgi:hypothetical protein
MKRVVTTVYADGVLDADELGEVPFKVTELLAKDEVATSERIGNGTINFIFEFAVVLSRINERNTIIQSASPLQAGA